VIIQRLQAEQLHKYRRLRLTELPEQGIIAVSGDNETGKSGIGEIICFALFGRTYVLSDERIGKLVHWGASQGSVRLRFRAAGRNYEIIRHLEHDGRQSARLLCPEESSEPLVRGGDPVTEAMQRILGYGFNEYIETFYLAQREITTPHPHSPAVKAIAGVVPFERCKGELGDQIRHGEDSERRLRARLSEVGEAIAGLGTDHRHLEELELQLAERADQERETAERIDGLEAAASAYCRDCRGQRSHALRRGIARLTATLVFGVLLVGAGLSWMLKLRPEVWPLPAIQGHLGRLVGSLGLAQETAMLYAAIILIGVLLLAMVWLLILSLRTRRRRTRARRLAEELELIDALEPAALRRAELPAEPLSEADLPIEAPRLVDEPDSERRSRLQEKVLGLTATADEVDAAVKHEVAWLVRRRELLNVQTQEDGRTLEQARADARAFQTLIDEQADLEGRIADEGERIAVRRFACSLLDGASKQSLARFSEHLRGMVSRALPQFTEGRYEHLQLDEALQLRVYSPDKRRLLEIDEISSGTQRQIMLALRLALSEELLARVVKDGQFTFLDEPFAFFDKARMHTALNALVTLGGSLSQFWVVAQRFPPEAHIGLGVDCSQHPDTLELGRPETD
jgi:exonuclease SbcC